MKQRILSFDQYRVIHENYSTEEQGDISLDKGDAIETGEFEDGNSEGDTTALAPVDGDAEGEEISLDETDTEEELDENKELKEKITAIIDANYKESLKDVFDGIINELEEDIDIEVALDAISDVLAKKMEAFANGEGEDEEGAESTEDDGLGETPVDGEEAPAPTEGEGTEGEQPAPAPAPEEDETIDL